METKIRSLNKFRTSFFISFGMDHFILLWFTDYIVNLNFKRNNYLKHCKNNSGWQDAYTTRDVKDLRSTERSTDSHLSGNAHTHWTSSLNIEVGGLSCLLKVLFLSLSFFFATPLLRTKCVKLNLLYQELNVQMMSLNHIYSAYDHSMKYGNHFHFKD